MISLLMIWIIEVYITTILLEQIDIVSIQVGLIRWFKIVWVSMNLWSCYIYVIVVISGTINYDYSEKSNYDIDSALLIYSTSWIYSAIIEVETSYDHFELL